jgi:hypothetical protein
MRESIAHALTDVLEVRAQADPDRPTEEIRADIFIQVAQGIGILLVADIATDAWELPYQNVTMPLSG